MSAHRILASPMRWALLVGLAATLATAASPLAAQASGSTLPAAAQILPPGVSGSGTQELRFGNVTPGQTIDILPAVAGAGAQQSSAGWLFENLKKGHLAYVSLSLPPGLTSGGNSIPIDWSLANHASLCVFGSSGLCQITDLFGLGSSVFRLVSLPNSLVGTDFDLRLLVGARITVPLATPPGVYTASATANFAYLF